MPNRIYMIIAFAILVGAPLIVQIVSGLVPVASEAVQTAGAPTPSRADLDSASAEQPFVAPVQPPPPPSAEALVESEPTLDPQGIAPTAAFDGGFTDEPPPPPPSRREERSDDEDDVGPPPPRQPAYLDR